uniref:Uncharacterized protein n=1 Tax=Anguilla anguilla TaxID=7936 RepID=A0A0E9Q8J2_ANGAN
MPVISSAECSLAVMPFSNVILPQL